MYQARSYKLLPQVFQSKPAQQKSLYPAKFNFVPLTNPAEEDLDLGEHAITDISELLLIANGAASTPPEDMLTLYTNNSKLRYIDDTGTAYQVATSTDIGSYLPLAGGTMTGNININGNAIVTNIDGKYPHRQ